MKKTAYYLSLRFRWMLALLFLVTFLGFGAKLYKGAAADFLNNYIAGLLYEVFWCLVIAIFWRNDRNVIRIPIVVFLATSLLEVLQLWDPPALHFVRSFFLGRALIGTTFNWWDFLFYLLGVVISGFILSFLYKLPSSPSRN